MPKRYIERPVGRAELQSLVALASAEEASFFERNPHLVEPYRDRLVGVALCQGAALQYLGIGCGINDFDVHFFYRQNPTRLRLSRRVKRTRATVASFHDIAVDFIRTVIPLRSRATEHETALPQLLRLLRNPPTPNGEHLAKKAVIGLLRASLFGVVIWPVP
jgi:hypothetical protein